MYVLPVMFPVFPAEIEYVSPLAEVKVPAPHETVFRSVDEKIHVCPQPQLAIFRVLAGSVPSSIFAPSISTFPLFISSAAPPDEIGTGSESALFRELNSELFVSKF